MHEEKPFVLALRVGDRPYREIRFSLAEVVSPNASPFARLFYPAAAYAIGVAVQELGFNLKPVVSEEQLEFVDEEGNPISLYELLLRRPRLRERALKFLQRPMFAETASGITSVLEAYEALKEG